MESNVESELKKLVLDEKFNSLQNLVNEEVNLMEILKVSHKELQHSNFLAWMFNPNGSHNLGDLFLKEFIKIYFRENGHQNLGTEFSLSVFDFVLLDFSDLEIRREYKNIDLILLSKKNKFCLVIENKIYSGERTGQLKKYREQIEQELAEFKYRIYIYLSLHDQQISEDERDKYVQLNYSHIVKVLECVLNSKSVHLAEKTKFVFEQYLQTLKSMLNMNKEIEQVAQELYRAYKPAFDLVFKYTMSSDNDETSAISNKISELIENETTIKPFHSNKTYKRFQPVFLRNNLNQLKKHGLVTTDDDLKNNWVFLFEFNIRKNKVTFDCKVGDGEQNTRKKLYDIYKKYPAVFTRNLSKELSPQWHLVFQREILSQSEIESYLSDEKSQKSLTERFVNLIKNDIPKIVGCIETEIANANP
jgi:hypothetical protein